MSIIREWAAQWGVGFEAVRDLEFRLGVHGGRISNRECAESLPLLDPKSEAYVQSQVVLEAAQKQIRLYRNNSGALKDQHGQLVRFGLGNISKAVNEVFKSSDLIGWRKTLVTPEMVGSHVAVAWAREIKAPDWVYTGDAHERAQLNFINLLNADGGNGAFTNRAGTL